MAKEVLERAFFWLRNPESVLLQVFRPTRKVKSLQLVCLLHLIGGSVADYLAKNDPFNERNSLSILHQVLSGLDFMHRCRIIHGDVKGKLQFSNTMCSKLNCCSIIYAG